MSKKIQLKDKCVICNFLPLKIEPTSLKTPDDEMSYGDFAIRFEHKFITFSQKNKFNNQMILIV